MNNFIIINHIRDIPFHPEWMNHSHYYENANGERVSINDASKQYEVIVKQRKFSKWERLIRALEAIWILILQNEISTFKNLLIDSYEIKYYKINLGSSLFPQKNPNVPKEISFKVLSFLDGVTLADCLLVNKNWQTLASSEKLWNDLIPKIAFGKKEWETYFGDVGLAPPLPKKIHHLLKRFCPFQPEKTVEETHMLVLIPATIDGKALTFKLLGKIIKHPKQGHNAQYRDAMGLFLGTYGAQAIDRSHWVLMRKEIIPNSRNKTDKEQLALIEEINLKNKIDYTFPCPLDAAISVLMHHVRSGERLLNIDTSPWTHTRCKKIDDEQSFIVGGFLGEYASHFPDVVFKSKRILIDTYTNEGVRTVGVAPLRHLCLR